MSAHKALFMGLQGPEDPPEPQALALGADVACAKLLIWAKQPFLRVVPTLLSFPWVKILPGQTGLEKHPSLHPATGLAELGGFP